VSIIVRRSFVRLLMAFVFAVAGVWFARRSEQGEVLLYSLQKNLQYTMAYAKVIELG